MQVTGILRKSMAISTAVKTWVLSSIWISAGMWSDAA
jgi:hypothetical protein